MKYILQFYSRVKKFQKSLKPLWNRMYYVYVRCEVKRNKIQAKKSGQSYLEKITYAYNSHKILEYFISIKCNQSVM